MKYDVLTIGGIMRDIIFFTREGTILKNPQNPLCQKLICFEMGAKIYINEIYFEAGGGAANTAVGLSKLGLRTAIIGRVGDDKEGKRLIKELKEKKVATHLIQIDKNVSSGFTFILAIKNKKRAHTIFAYRGTNDKLLFKINREELKNIKQIYLSSISSPIWDRCLEDIFSLVDKRIKIAWNPSNVQLKAGWKKLKKYLAKTDILILNDDEARELVFSKEKRNGDLNNNRYLLKRICEMGPRLVAITVGKYGAYAGIGEKVYYQKQAPAKVIHATGAGDSFSAGFLASLFYEPENIQKALKWGVTNSASVIDHIGAQRGLLNKAQIIKLSKNV